MTDDHSIFEGKRLWLANGSIESDNGTEFTIDAKILQKIQNMAQRAIENEDRKQKEEKVRFFLDKVARAREELNRFRKQQRDARGSVKSP